MKQKAASSYRIFGRFSARVATVTVLSVVAFASIAVPVVRADQFDEKINNLRSQNNDAASNLQSLQVQADSYQAAVAQLQAQITALQTQIAANQAQQASLQQQIIDKQAELDNQRALLGDDIKAMYVDGEMSAIEMLAISKTLSEYVDKEEYRNAVQKKIEDSLALIAKLQSELKQQKVVVDQLVAAQKGQQAQLDSDRSQQADLLAMNEAAQANYNSKIQANNADIATLRSQQAAAIAAASRSVRFSQPPSGGSGGACDNGSGNGSYPMAWCNAYKDSIYDSSGIENRECTSYAYWNFTQLQGKALSVSGDAKYWAGSSSRGWSYTPHVGDIGVYEGGNWGHVTIVEAVGPTTWGGVSVPAGGVLVSSMNYDLAGHFHYDIYNVGSLKYIH